MPMSLIMARNSFILFSYIAFQYISFISKHHEMEVILLQFCKFYIISYTIYCTVLYLPFLLSRFVPIAKSIL